MCKDGGTKIPRLFLSTYSKGKIMANLNSAIQHILIESNDVDVSGKYTLFALYTDNTAALHLFEDRTSFEAMKHKFTSNDNIKRLGASKLPENTTFKKLSESIGNKFNVPRNSISVHTHPKGQNTTPAQEMPQRSNAEVRKPIQNATRAGSVLESVIKGKERFSETSTNNQHLRAEPKSEPSINSFKPSNSNRIDLSNLHDGNNPPQLG